MKKDPVPQMSGICALIAASDHRRAEKGGGSLRCSPSPCISRPPKDLKGQHQLSPFICAFPLLGATH